MLRRRAGLLETANRALLPLRAAAAPPVSRITACRTSGFVIAGVVARVNGHCRPAVVYSVCTPGPCRDSAAASSLADVRAASSGPGERRKRFSPVPRPHRLHLSPCHVLSFMARAPDSKPKKKQQNTGCVLMVLMLGVVAIGVVLNSPL